MRLRHGAAACWRHAAIARAHATTREQTRGARARPRRTHRISVSDPTRVSRDHREGDADRGALPDGAGDRERAAQRVDAVGQPDQAGPISRVGTALAVVPDVHPHGVVVGVDRDLDCCRVRVLGNVRQGLGDDVVDADLDRLRKPVPTSDVELDRHRSTARDVAQRGPKPTFGQDRRVDAVRDLSEVVECPRQPFADSGKARKKELARPGLRDVLGSPYAEPERDQALLHPVVQVAFDESPRLVGGRHDPRPRRIELGPRLRVRHGSRGELRELAEPELRPRRDRLVRPGRGHHDPPQPAVDDDRAADARLHAEIAEALRQMTCRGREAVHPGQSAVSQDGGRHVVAVQFQSAAHRDVPAGHAPGRDDGRLAVRLVAEHGRDVDRQELADLIGDGGEDVVRGRLARNQGRHST